MRHAVVQKKYYVYILTSKNHRVLYTGVTNNLQRRIGEHDEKKGSEFTLKYHIRRLVYYETFDDAHTAIAREKQIKAGSRQKKIQLIEGMNPEWKDLGQQL